MSWVLVVCTMLQWALGGGPRAPRESNMGIIPRTQAVWGSGARPWSVQVRTAVRRLGRSDWGWALREY